MSTDQFFEHGASFEAGELSGHVRVDRFEAHYEQLFAEVLEDGVITAEERAELDRAATALGLDRERLRRLEEALQAAYEARHHVQVREEAPAWDEPRPSLAPLDAADPRIAVLNRRIAVLEARVTELEHELEEARSHVAVEVDLSDMPAVVAEQEQADPAEIHRRIRRDPRDSAAVRALYQACEKAGDNDRRFCAAQALVYLGTATEEETAFYNAHRPDGLIKPATSLSAEAWKRLLLHPDEEVLTGEIFAVIVPAVLLGRVAALRHAKALPALDAHKRQDPRTTTVQAARCFGWAGSILGMGQPPLYADPEHPGTLDMIPGVPPACRLGRLALSGRSPQELAFLAGKHLSWYREEHFMRLLLPSIPDLEDVFLAALILGSPGLPLAEAVRRKVEPLARAIEPLLDRVQLDRLRGAFLRFVEEGGRTNLQRWAVAADRTAVRTGFLLASDLGVAQRMLELEKAPEARDLMDDLLVFSTSERYVGLRQRLGIAV